MTIERGSHKFVRDFDPVGIIRLGSAKSARGGFGTELSHFRLDDAPKVAEKYGATPSALHVLLPSDDPNEVFEDKYELWEGSKKEGVKGVLLCFGNGLTCERLVDRDNMWNRETMPCPTPEGCAYASEHTSQKARADGASACGAVGRLSVICYRVNVMEVYEVRTGSWNAFQGLRNKLQSILEHPMFRRLTGIPMVMERVPKPNRFGKVNYPVRLRTMDWKEMQEEADWLRKVIETVNKVTFALPDPGFRRPPPALAGPPSDLIHEGQGVTEGAATDAPPPPARESSGTSDEEEPEPSNAEQLCPTCGGAWPGPGDPASDHPDRCPDCLQYRGPGKDSSPPPAPTPTSRGRMPPPPPQSKKERAQQAGKAVAGLLREKQDAERREREAGTEERVEKARARDAGKSGKLFNF